ncbi:MAG: Gfo/Idh/MocA family oxidoreductase, partial [Lachnospiraceae bacterium]|nr:Gfo/Idh/MocA family oxidoreductase [Lachnospiraceae bacterium]
MKKLKFVCAGGWHIHALDFPMDRAPKKVPHLEKEFAAVWDNDKERGEKWAEAMNCMFVEDYDQLLAIPDIDGVLITSETSMHEELIVKAAEAGINVFVEKALTTTNESAYRIREAVKRSNIKFTVSDPVRHGDLLYAKELVDKGVIGELISVRSRMSNACAINDQDSIRQYYEVECTGGGAMIDMGYHNIHRIQWFLGKPVRAASILVPFTDYGKEKKIDENSIAVFEFESGKIGIAETSWLTEDATAFE